MSKLLVLHDTHEKDLARDIADFLRELDCEVTLIPQAPDLGKTLQEKERHYFNSVDGVVFLLTPGVDRGAAKLPSPSVADEMGQAKRLFDKKPERVIYLVDDRCTPHSIDQRAYIGFTHDNLRSIIDALTRLLRNLKAAGLVGQRPPEAREAPSVDILSVSKKTDNRLKDICDLMSQLPKGVVEHQRFRELLRIKYQMSDQDVNFAERDLQTHGLVTFQRSHGPLVFGFFVLTPVGWELVRHEKASSQNVENWLQEILGLAPRPLLRKGGPGA